MNRNEFDANEALAASSWQNRQGRPEEWEQRAPHGAGVVLAVLFTVMAAATGFAVFMLSVHFLVPA